MTSVARRTNDSGEFSEGSQEIDHSNSGNVSTVHQVTNHCKLSFWRSSITAHFLRTARVSECPFLFVRLGSRRLPPLTKTPLLCLHCDFTIIYFWAATYFSTQTNGNLSLRMQLLKVESLVLQEGDPVDSDYDTPGDISDSENPENQVSNYYYN